MEQLLNKIVRDICAPSVPGVVCKHSSALKVVQNFIDAGLIRDEDCSYLAKILVEADDDSIALLP